MTSHAKSTPSPDEADLTAASDITAAVKEPLVDVLVEPEQTAELQK